MTRRSDRLRKRDLAHRARQDDALRDAGFTPDGGRSLREAMDARAREERPGRGTPTLGLLWLLVALVAQTVLWGSVAVSNHPLTLVAVVVSLVCVWRWWTRRMFVERRTWAAAGVAVAVVAGLGVVGMASQTVTDTGVLRVGGREERTLQQAELLRNDLRRIQYWSDLALLSDDEAKVRSGEIEQAAQAAVELAGAADQKWAAAELGEVARRIRAAAGYSHDALVLRYDTALQRDQAKLDAIGGLVSAADEQAAQAATLRDMVVSSVRGEGQ